MKLFAAIVVLMPWKIKRLFLCIFWGYELHPTARIGLSWFFPDKLVMAPFAKVGHLNVAIHLSCIRMDEYSSIGRGNWITGYSRGATIHFSHKTCRCPELVLGRHSAITKSHHIDCTDKISIGSYTTVAGYGSQFLTHSIDIYKSRQDCQPICIGDYCFLGTDVVVLGGSVLPNCTILGAKSLLNKVFNEERVVIGGVPAKKIFEIKEDAAYFIRKVGVVI